MQCMQDVYSVCTISSNMKSSRMHTSQLLITPHSSIRILVGVLPSHGIVGMQTPL